jgi:hypothetical protein
LVTNNPCIELVATATSVIVGTTPATTNNERQQMIETKTFRCGPKDQNWATDLYLFGKRCFCGRGFETLRESLDEAQKFLNDGEFRRNAMRFENEIVRDLVEMTLDPELTPA